MDSNANAGGASGFFDAPSALLARNWGWVLLRGVLAIAVGILAISMPLAAIGGLVLLFAAYCAADGLLAIVSAVRAARHDERWGWFVFEGVAGLAAAAVAMLLPVIAVLSLVVLAAIWAIVTGGAMLVAAFRLQADHGRWWLGIGGALSVAWGILLLIQPGIGALVLTIWFGAYALVLGILLTVLAFRLRNCAIAQH